MKYISVQEAARQWDISPRRVQFFCANGKISGAQHLGRQWVIPADAERPPDGRTKQGKAQPVQQPYHFPVLIYTPYYSDPSVLDEQEQQLLQAQKLHLEGKYVESIGLCRNLLEDPVSPCLSAGIYFTLAFNFISLGLYSEYKISLDALNKASNEDSLHGDDYRLMGAFVQLNSDLQASHVLSFYPEKLSPEAIPFYKYCLLVGSTTSCTRIFKTVSQYIRSDCPLYEAQGITPLLLHFHSLLGTINHFEQDDQGSDYHTQKAVKIAVENHWLPCLIRYYNMYSPVFEKHLTLYGNICLHEMRKIYHTGIQNWRMIHGLETGSNPLAIFPDSQREIVYLFIHGYTYKQIADINGLSQDEVKLAFQEIWKIANVHTKAAWDSYIKAVARALLPES